MKALTLSPVVFLAAGLAAADPALECNTGASSQVEIGECGAETEARVEAALEAALGFAMSSATDLDEIMGREAALPALEASQESWADYRNAHCDFAGTTFGSGSGSGIAIRACRVELGRARIAELLRYAQ